MAKTPLPIVHDPYLDEVYSYFAGFLAQFEMSQKDFATRDGPRNLRTARALHNRGMSLRFSGIEHGPDAWLLRDMFVEEIEMKSALEGNQFQFYTDTNRETPELLERLSNTSYILSVFRRGEQLVEVYYLASGSALNDFFRERLELVVSGQPQIRKGISLTSVKKFGAIKIV
jgi:hypothetical protein